MCIKTNGTKIDINIVEIEMKIEYNIEIEIEIKIDVYTETKNYEYVYWIEYHETCFCIDLSHVKEYENIKVKLYFKWALKSWYIEIDSHP